MNDKIIRDEYDTFEGYVDALEGRIEALEAHLGMVHRESGCDDFRCVFNSEWDCPEALQVGATNDKN